MLAARWHGPLDLRLEKVPIPKVAPKSVLVKVYACAVCGSDNRIFRFGDARVVSPRTIGHEIAGKVVDVGSGVTRFRPGDRVTVGADIPCGECDHCRAGRPNCCQTNLAIGYQYDGGFAEYLLLEPLVVEQGPIQKFSSGLDYEIAALAEPLACCLNGYQRVLGASPVGGTVVVFGAGPIGIMLTMLAPLKGADRVIVIEPNTERRQAALVAGADVSIDPEKLDSVKTVMNLTDGKGADMIFTACPSLESQRDAMAMVATRGVVNLFGGLPKDTPKLEIYSNEIHYKEACVTGSHGSTPEQHKEAIELIERKVISVEQLISRRLSLPALVSFMMSQSPNENGLKTVAIPNG